MVRTSDRSRQTAIIRPMLMAMSALPKDSHAINVSIVGVLSARDNSCDAINIKIKARGKVTGGRVLGKLTISTHANENSVIQKRI